MTGVDSDPRAGAEALAQAGSAGLRQPVTATAPELPRDLPVSLFGAIMGLAALGIAWRAAAAQFALPGLTADAFSVAAVAGFLALAAGYAMKITRFPGVVRAEFGNPTTRNYFGMPLICLLLLSILIAPIAPATAVIGWLAGAVGMLVFAWAMVSHWLAQPQQRASVTTAWLVVAIGILDIPLAMPALGLASTRSVGLACVAVGLSLAAALYTVILPRYLFEPAPPAGQTPALLIAVAPFAVGCSSTLTVVPQAALFAQGLLAVAVTLLAALVVPVGHHMRRSPFRLSWWGTGFPVAATAGAALRYASVTHMTSDIALAGGVLVLATVLISWLLLRTLVGAFSGGLAKLLV